jgi:hypothetical protein
MEQRLPHDAAEQPALLDPDRNMLQLGEYQMGLV